MKSKFVMLVEMGSIVTRKAIGPKPAAMVAEAKKPADTTKLEAAFRAMGHDPESARIASRGRGGRLVAATSMTEAARELGYTGSQAKTWAQGRSRFVEVVKNAAGLSSKSFAFVSDENDPLGWKLQICRSEDPDRGWQPDEELVRAAVAQLPGIAGYGVGIDIPASALPGVKSVLRSAWIACGAALGEMPPELQQEALTQAFAGLGLSPRAAEVATRGRA